MPYDEGVEAYVQRKLPGANPYIKGDWKYDEWLLGWSQTEECDSHSFDWATGKFKS